MKASPSEERMLNRVGLNRRAPVGLAAYEGNNGTIMVPYRSDTGKVFDKEDLEVLLFFTQRFFAIDNIDAWIDWQHGVVNQLHWIEAGLDISEPSSNWKVQASKLKPGWVYILKAGPFYKIGYSKNVDRRIEQLSTLPPFDLELVHTIRANHMPELESALHRRFQEKHKNGEWFELAEEDVTWLKTL